MFRIKDLWDGEGKKTHWDYDFTSRLTKKIFPDGKEINYAYEPLSGRLSTITDSLGQVKTHSYFIDGNLKEIAYANTLQPTPNISFIHDPFYDRLGTMTDGNGTTSFGYHPVNGSTFGAGLLASINGPFANDTITQTYDFLSRPKIQTINGTEIAKVDIYDALSRITQFANPLGTFTQTYDPENLMPKLTTAPNGLTTTIDYHPAAADLHLKEIYHTRPGDFALSKHVYGYKPAGNIKFWAQTLDSGPVKTWSIIYDEADQLEAASQTENGAVIGHQALRLDKSGNITSRSVGVSPNTVSLD